MCSCAHVLHSLTFPFRPIAVRSFPMLIEPVKRSSKRSVYKTERPEALFFGPKTSTSYNDDSDRLSCGIALLHSVGTGLSVLRFSIHFFHFLLNFLMIICLIVRIACKVSYHYYYLSRRRRVKGKRGWDVPPPLKFGKIVFRAIIV